MIKAADPLDPFELDTWPETRALQLLLARIGAEAQSTRASRRRLVSLTAAIALVGLSGVGAAVAAGLLGGPAPDAVKAHLAELDRGMPADLRYNPDVDHARAVAEVAAGVLYFANLKDGGYCLEVASKGDQPRGATCVSAANLASLPLDVLAPLPAGDGEPLLVGGRANSTAINTLIAVFSDGVEAPIELGPDRAWLLQVPETEQASALTDGLVVKGIDATGAVVATLRLPALRDDDPWVRRTTPPRRSFSTPSATAQTSHDCLASRVASTFPDRRGSSSATQTAPWQPWRADAQRRLPLSVPGGSTGRLRQQCRLPRGNPRRASRRVGAGRFSRLLATPQRMTHR